MWALELGFFPTLQLSVAVQTVFPAENFSTVAGESPSKVIVAPWGGVGAQPYRLTRGPEHSRTTQMVQHPPLDGWEVVGKLKEFLRLER